MLDKIKKEKGFTLMELMVSSSIFVIVVLSSLSIYSILLKTSQKTIAIARVQQEAEFIIQVLVKKIRTSVVNYNYYVENNPEEDGLVSVLVLTDVLGDNYYFKQSDDENSLAVKVNEGGEYQNIPATNVSIQNLKFYINPIVNPFSLDAPPLSQPYVMLSAELTAYKNQQTTSLNIQQVVPQRSPFVIAE